MLTLFMGCDVCMICAELREFLVARLAIQSLFEALILDGNNGGFNSSIQLFGALIRVVLLLLSF